MNHRKRLAFAVLGLALAGPTFAAKRNIHVAGPAMLARYDMDVNVVCDPNTTQIIRGFVEQPCTYFFPIADTALKGQWADITLYALDQNAVYDIEAKLLRKRIDTEDAFDDPDTVMEVASEGDDGDLQIFDGVPNSSNKKIETAKYFYYLEVIIPDLNLGVIGVRIRYDDKAK